MKHFPDLQNIKSSPWLAPILTTMGAALFLFQTWIYAHTQVSNLDEGNYLYKGYLFATGQYWPFQDYGPRTNHMPLSFLIPGYFQKWFGPSLAAGRFLAWGLGALTLVGIWLLFRRLGGKWWAAAAIWLFAINPAAQKMISIMTSQPQILLMLVWVLVLTLGADRARWQLILGALIAGLALVTRLNLAPLFPLLVVYIWWEHGWRSALWAALSGGLVIVMVHAIFWPGILRMWATWLPAELTPFLNPYRAPGGILAWNPGSDLYSVLLSLFTGLRFQFVHFLGFVFSIFFFARPKNWRTPSDFRAAVFLSVLFFVLFTAHAWASLSWSKGPSGYYASSYCVFCFPAYFSFFSISGLVLLAISLPNWPRHIHWGYQILILIFVVVVCVGIGFGAFENIGNPLLEISIPRIKNGQIQTGSATLWQILENKFGWPYAQSRRIAPAVAGGGLGLLIILLAGAFRLLQTKFYSAAKPYPFAALAGLFLLASAFVLTPTPVLGGGSHESDCSADSLAAYAELGAYLGAIIPPGAQIYWDGILSPAPLLYLSDVKIYPPQLNGAYGYYLSINGTVDEHLRHGSWNQPLATQWRAEADYFLIGTRSKDSNAFYIENPDLYRLVGESPPIDTCQPDEYIQIFQRVE